MKRAHQEPDRKPHKHPGAWSEDASQESQKWAAEKNKVPNKPMQKLNKS
jgi:hypothetical protein